MSVKSAHRLKQWRTFLYSDETTLSFSLASFVNGNRFEILTLIKAYTTLGSGVICHGTPKKRRGGSKSMCGLSSRRLLIPVALNREIFLSNFIQTAIKPRHRVSTNKTGRQDNPVPPNSLLNCCLVLLEKKRLLNPWVNQSKKRTGKSD